jgi:hypothetical protein
MARKQQVEASLFMTVYTGVKYLALYAGCFFGCYFWPLFIYGLVGEHADPRKHLVAGVLITPLGFLILGMALGRYTAIMHAILLAVGAAAAFVGFTQLMGDEEALPRLIAVWTPVILLVYLAAAILAWRRELKAA